jgi:hypothetical protein
MRKFVVKREGTTSVVPLSPSFLSFRAGFSPRGVCSFDFFSSLLGAEPVLSFFEHAFIRPAEAPQPLLISNEASFLRRRASTAQVLGQVEAGRPGLRADGRRARSAPGKVPFRAAKNDEGTEVILRASASPWFDHLFRYCCEQLRVHQRLELLVIGFEMQLQIGAVGVHRQTLHGYLLDGRGIHLLVHDTRLQ